MGIGSSASSGESRYVDATTGDTYVGPTVDGKPEGHGIWTMGDGTGTYTGQFKAGVFEGNGKFVNEGEGTYEGEWRNGLRHGHGEVHSPHGARDAERVFSSYIRHSGKAIPGWHRYTLHGPMEVRSRPTL